MIIYVDIDNTICNTSSNNYELSTPITDRINRINEMHDSGHTIVYWTARGSVTKIDWFNTTKSQLDQWGCKYHELRMGKPSYDLFIDDKNINSNTFFND